MNLGHAWGGLCGSLAVEMVTLVCGGGCGAPGRQRSFERLKQGFTWNDRAGPTSVIARAGNGGVTPN